MTVEPNPPVVAGIDGSAAAVQAAEWAVDEAVSRDVPLRLVYVTKAKHLGAEDYYADVRQAKASLHEARAAIEATGAPVKLEVEMLEGRPGTALVSASRDAAMICVGSVGFGRYARSILGSTATELAESARCPVAIIRPQSGDHRKDINWIVVAVKDRDDDEDVISAAMAEAVLRKAPVLLLGDRRAKGARGERLSHEVDRWRSRYPDVHIYPVADSADVTRFLNEHDERVQLAVIGGRDAKDVTAIVGPARHPVFRHSESSVLVVR